MLKASGATLPFLAKAICWVQSAPHLTARAIRYAMVGIGNSVVFASTSALAISLLGMPPVVASGFGYLCSVPLSFVGHRSFTFRSNNAWKGEVGRFLLVHSCSLSAAILIMTAVTVAQLPYYIGLLGAVLLIPFVNFLVAHFWVFAKRLKGE